MPNYWEKRKARELYENLIPAEEAAEELRKLYFLLSKELQEEATKIAKRFQLEHRLSKTEAYRLLRKVSAPDDIQQIINLLKADPANAELAAELEAPAYAARIRRLSNVQQQLDTLVMGVAPTVTQTFAETLTTIAQRSYYQTMIGYQEQVGANFPIAPLDEQRIMDILNRRWSGKNFSERIWDNTAKLAQSVKRELMAGILVGKTRTQMANDIQEELSTASYETRRLIRTEGTYVSGQMDLEAYKANGVENYRYVAILDARTSEICRSLDGKVFPVAEAIPGVNYPPMHPWCRSTTTEAMPAGLEELLVVRTYDENGTTGTRTLAEDNAVRAPFTENTK